MPRTRGMFGTMRHYAAAMRGRPTGSPWTPDEVTPKQLREDIIYTIEYFSKKFCSEKISIRDNIEDLIYSLQAYQNTYFPSPNTHCEIQTPASATPPPITLAPVPTRKPRRKRKSNDSISDNFSVLSTSPKRCEKGREDEEDCEEEEEVVYRPLQFFCD